MSVGRRTKSRPIRYEYRLEGCFLLEVCGSVFSVRILTRSHLQIYVSLANRNSLFLCEKIRFILPAAIRANAKTNCLLWSGAAKRRPNRCSAHIIQAPEPTLTASGLAAKRLSFGILYCDTIRLAAAAVVSEHVSTRRMRLGFYARTRASRL